VVVRRVAASFVQFIAINDVRDALQSTGAWFRGRAHRPMKSRPELKTVYK